MKNEKSPKKLADFYGTIQWNDKKALQYQRDLRDKMTKTNQAEKSAKIMALLETIEQLRSPNGCPWDREQTHESLKRYLIEETYEVIAAIDEQSDESLYEELGDLLFQICLHAQIQSERGNFDFADIAEKLNKKMISRHPHVFDENYKIKTSEQVVEQWEEIKAKEKPQTNSPFESIPPTLPALMRAVKIFKKAGKLKLNFTEQQKNTFDNIKDEKDLGDSLIQLVMKAKELNLDPEEILRQRIAKIQIDFEKQYIGEKK